MADLAKLVKANQESLTIPLSLPMSLLPNRGLEGLPEIGFLDSGDTPIRLTCRKATQSNYSLMHRLLLASVEDNSQTETSRSAPVIH